MAQINDIGHGAQGWSFRRKQFFFEKKNQKTFIRLSTRRRCLTRQSTEQKFFVSFFQKRNASLLLRCVAATATHASRTKGTAANAGYRYARAVRHTRRRHAGAGA
jgi:hypothetical protein